jgi:hypothetical protein
MIMYQVQWLDSTLYQVLDLHLGVDHFDQWSEQLLSCVKLSMLFCGLYR